VDIEVSCEQGLNDAATLSLTGEAILSRLLEKSYNAVHRQVKDDDSELSNVAFEGARSVSSVLPRQQNRHHTKTIGSWIGDLRCRLCPNNDGYTLLPLASTTGEALKAAWENEFVANILESNHAALKNVQSCEITMKKKASYGYYYNNEELNVVEDQQEASQDESPSNEDATDDWSDDEPNVELGVRCDGLDLSALTVPQGSFVAYALQSTYNQVHATGGQDHHHHLNDDDFQLSELSYTGGARHRRDLQSTDRHHHEKDTVGAWIGGWGCRLCPGDDDRLLLAVGPDQALWEQVFASVLQELWQSVKTCTIEMRPYYDDDANSVEESSSPSSLDEISDYPEISHVGTQLRGGVRK
jgi:hypothetical protein